MELEPSKEDMSKMSVIDTKATNDTASEIASYMIYIEPRRKPQLLGNSTYIFFQSQWSFLFCPLWTETTWVKLPLVVS